MTRGFMVLRVSCLTSKFSSRLYLCLRSDSDLLSLIDSLIDWRTHLTPQAPRPSSKLLVPVNNVTPAQPLPYTIHPVRTKNLPKMFGFVSTTHSLRCATLLLTYRSHHSARPSTSSPSSTRPTPPPPPASSTSSSKPPPTQARPPTRRPPSAPPTRRPPRRPRP